jgi:hypothetical protein
VEIMPDDLVLISGWEQIVFAASRIEEVICNRWEINREYEKVLS